MNNTEPAISPATTHAKNVIDLETIVEAIKDGDRDTLRGISKNIQDLLDSPDTPEEEYYRILVVLKRNAFVFFGLLSIQLTPKLRTQAISQRCRNSKPT